MEPILSRVLVLSSCFYSIPGFYDYSMYGQQFGRTHETSSGSGYDPNFLRSLQAAVQQAWATQGESPASYAMSQGEPSASYGMMQPERPSSYGYNNDPYNTARVYGSSDDQFDLMDQRAIYSALHG